MALNDYKVSEIYGGTDVTSLSDRPNEDGMLAAQLKQRFDNLIKGTIPEHNGLIDYLITLLEQGNTTNGHKHNVDNLVDGVINRLFTEVLKLKLDGIAFGAEVNQNAFSNIKVGATTGNADSKTATFEIVAGLNIVASIDPLTNKISLSATGDIATEAVQSVIDDIGNYFTSLEVNGALQEIGAILYPSLAKTTPVDADTLLVVDSQASSIFKKLSWANIKATLKTYFDGLYPSMTTGNITYYVATTGSNSNDGLSAGSPFLTIAYALSKIPKNVYHTITINVASGTYNETILLTSFNGSGALNIYGGTDLASAVNFKVNDIVVSTTNCNISIRGFELLTTTNIAIQIFRSMKINLSYCTTTVLATSYRGIYIDYSKVFIANCLISNRQYALYVRENSEVVSSDWSSGSGNSNGIYAIYGGKIAKSGTQPQGTIAESVAGGGIITLGVINPAPLDSPTFINPSGTTQALGNDSTYLATTAFLVRALKADERPIQLALSDETTTLTTGTGKLTFRMPYACKFTKIPRINLNTVSSSGLVTVDIKKNGTTIFSTLLTIDVSEKTSVTATTPCVLSSNPTTFADDDEITFDITVAGTGAKGLKATLFVEKV